MNQQSFREYYENLSDDQLQQIMADRKDLVPEAVVALESEIRKRQLKPLDPPHWVRQSDSDERVYSLNDYPAYQKLDQRRRVVRRYMYFIALAPFVIGLVLGRNTLGNSLVFIVLSMGWAMCAAAYGIYINFRFLGFKCPQCSQSFGRGEECFSCGFPRNAFQGKK